MKVGDVVTGTKESQWLWDVKTKIKEIVILDGREGYVVEKRYSEIDSNTIWWAGELRLIKYKGSLKNKLKSYIDKHK